MTIRLTVTPEQLGGVITREVIDRLTSTNVLGELLTLQARRRIDAGGDSQHQYPDLWGNVWSFRLGGQALLDTRKGWLSLHGVTLQDIVTRGVRVLLRGLLYMVYHQHGFETKGPNYIPLTNTGKIGHITGANPLDEGLVQLMPDGTRRKKDKRTGQIVETDADPDFMMAWKGVKVPQRKVFNMPPEDRAEVIDTIRQAIGA